MSNVLDASNYLLTVNQLSQQKTETRQEQPAPINENLLSSFPYLPFILSGVLFASVMFVQLMRKIRTARDMIIALSIALFAASIPATLPYIQTGVRQETKASPQTQPKKLAVVQLDATRAEIVWDTDIETVGAVRIWPSTSNKDLAKLYYSNNTHPKAAHAVTVTNLKKGERYLFEILSNTEWFSNETGYITFVFK